MKITLSEFIKKKVQDEIVRNPSITELCALALVKARFDSHFDAVFAEMSAQIEDEDTSSDETVYSNDGVSDAEYCAERFGENWDFL